MATIPSDDAHRRIRELSEVYVANGGDYLAQPSWWDVENWSRHIHPGWNLPNPITRNDVFRLVKEGKTVESAERAFVAVMLWGYGQTGYGPHRVYEMKSSRPEGLGQYMLGIVNAAGDSPIGAYEYMAKNWARKLGPSYASKVAYFVTDGEGSPILDSLVGRWIYNHHDRKWVFNPNKWSTPQYEDYQSYCHDLLNEIVAVVPEGQRKLGLVEYLMFVDQVATTLPKWAKTI
jgi:hypothetical protein